MGLEHRHAIVSSSGQRADRGGNQNIRRTRRRGNMSKPVVSIITPTYNHERFIGQCIESVLDQTFPDWEMIIVDDESTDGTGSVLRGYNDQRVNYIRQE